MIPCKSYIEISALEFVQLANKALINLQTAWEKALSDLEASKQNKSWINKLLSWLFEVPFKPFGVSATNNIAFNEIRTYYDNRIFIFKKILYVLDKSKQSSILINIEEYALLLEWQ